MPEDASLDAFAAADEESSDESRPEADVGADAPETESDAESTADAPDVDPATSTYAWSPDRGECAVCGASVERRWRDDGALVCPDCKEW